MSSFQKALQAAIKQQLTELGDIPVLFLSHIPYLALSAIPRLPLGVSSAPQKRIPKKGRDRDSTKCLHSHDLLLFVGTAEGTICGMRVTPVWKTVLCVSCGFEQKDGIGHMKLFSIQIISLGVISHDFYLKLDESLDHSELSLV